MAEFAVNEKKYKSSRIDARRQFHLLARLSPIATALVRAAKQEVEAENKDAVKLAIFADLAGAISRMSDADRDYILDSCLGVVQRQQSGGIWSPIMAQGGVMMFDDIDPAVMLQIAGTVLMENLGPFFAELRSRFAGAAGFLKA
jgi:hypothetical protein